MRFNPAQILSDFIVIHEYAARIFYQCFYSFLCRETIPLFREPFKSYLHLGVSAYLPCQVLHDHHSPENHFDDNVCR